FFSSRRRHTRFSRDWSSDVCSSDLLFIYGAWRLSAPEAFVSGVKLRVVQPSVPQREKWMAEYQRRIFDDHIALSLANPQGKKDRSEERRVGKECRKHGARQQ